MSFSLGRFQLTFPLKKSLLHFDNTVRSPCQLGSSEIYLYIAKVNFKCIFCLQRVNCTSVTSVSVYD